jgi:nitrogen regulatory protein PII
MQFKLIVAIVANDRTELVVDCARHAGATGCTVITSARGEGLNPPSTFMGLTLEGQRDVVLLLVEGHLSRSVLESIASDARFDEDPGSGIAFQVDIEDAVGLGGQMATIQHEIEDEI